MHYDESDFLHAFDWQKQLIWGAIAVALHAAIIAAFLNLSHVPPQLPDIMSVSMISAEPSPQAPAPAPAPKQQQVVKPQQKPVVATPAPTVSQTPISTPQSSASSSTSSQSTATASGANSTKEVSVVPPSADAAYLNNPKPPYPGTAKRLGEEGKVLLHVYVLADGNVGKVEISKSSGSSRLDQSALDTVLNRWHFAPARRGNEAVDAWVTIPISFSLEK